MRQIERGMSGETVVPPVGKTVRTWRMRLSLWGWKLVPTVKVLTDSISATGLLNKRRDCRCATRLRRPIANRRDRLQCCYKFTIILQR